MTNSTLPTIHLVTPNFNGADFLEDTIASVIEQEYENLEYVLVDGASTDNSRQVLDRYRDQVSAVIIEPDNGHADALNKGFAGSRADIMGWINSDDLLMPGCLSIVGRIFATYPEVAWITGLPTTCDLDGKLTYVGPLKKWSQLRFLAGDHLWIQQESTFWRRSLWEQAGGRLDTDFKVANDFELWSRFFRQAELYSVDSMLGCFRIREGQRSETSRALYMREVDTVLRRELDELDPALRAKFNNMIPHSPRLLEASERAALHTILARHDPPAITRRGLRKQTPLKAPRQPEAPEPPASPRLKPWLRVGQRNWRFLCAGIIAVAICAAAAMAFPTKAVWILMAGGISGSVGLTLGLAIKVRRIVRTLLTTVAELQKGRAESAYRHHIAELYLDDLSEKRP
ncbi:hypothetical protein AWH62_11405 [Maricaulis sp. W15]|uniref:Glycosyltransferase involved in cell wall biosynthesis n=1 Tax=Maricaulis maris TaxID=74318 RepID=A0A495CXX3_9PROT|nr:MULTISPECIES: glycosyltransferase family 2 protein [Maricaulis]OLF71739.1 hypothetical protein AWH62_11405 [Maricaulis sp. W15]RKQ94146.1 glycosyltransferase involved in cell wall biosynthesis [Maricaulis maris]